MSAVHFLHIRKTGGNALKAALRPVADEFGLILHNHATTLRDVPKGEGVAFVLRDPVERFISGFNSRLRMGRPLRNSKWSAGEAEAFSRFKTPNDLAEALMLPACETALKAMYEIAHVKTGFSDTLGSREHVLERLNDIQWIGRTERLARDFERLRAHLRLPHGIALPTDPVAAHKTPEGFPKQLSEIGRRNIAEWYAADIEFVAWMERCVKPLVRTMVPAPTGSVHVATRVRAEFPPHAPREAIL